MLPLFFTEECYYYFFLTKNVTIIFLPKIATIFYRRMLPLLFTEECNYYLSQKNVTIIFYRRM